MIQIDEYDGMHIPEEWYRKEEDLMERLEQLILYQKEKRIADAAK